MAAACQTKKTTDKLVVAAIDFGTTYSGYAFSFRHDLIKEPLKISANNWVAGSGTLISQKTPTILLLKPDKSFEAFGYEAEERYHQLAEDDDDDKKHTDYFYFRRFKMLLHNAHIRRNTVVEDTKGKKLPAAFVFSASIKYLKEHLINTLHNRATGITEDDIQWVLTVPAIWNDGSKQFMREAAEKAGIKTGNLMISLEPEAASLFCMHLPVDKMIGGCDMKSSPMSPFRKGTKYMVVDVGGGTVDITSHEVVDNDKLKELSSASGGAWGGTRVDRAYETFLGKLFGDKLFLKFAKEAPEDLIDLHREFETKKRSISLDRRGNETIRVPARLAEMFTSETKKSPEAAVNENSEFKGRVTWKGGKLRVDAEIMRSWFDESCNETIKHIRALFKQKAGKDVSTILLVGGFSESPMMQNALRKEFPNKRLIVPEEAGLAVLKGAVLFGYNPITIVSRVAKCSYGIRVYRDFKPGVHPENKKIQIGRRVKCQDVFARHVMKGQELVVGEVQSKQRYTPLEADQMTLIFDVYTSTEEDPQYVTDVDCTYIGQLEVEVPDLSGGKERGVWVKMIFGGTEITVEGEDEKTKKITKASFDFLQLPVN